MTKAQMKRAARMLKNATPEQIKSNPWTVIKLMCYNNPEGLSIALTDLSGEEVSSDPENLYEWIVSYYNSGGDLGLILKAAQKVELRK